MPLVVPAARLAGPGAVHLRLPAGLLSLAASWGAASCLPRQTRLTLSRVGALGTLGAALAAGRRGLRALDLMRRRGWRIAQHAVLAGPPPRLAEAGAPPSTLEMLESELARDGRPRLLLITHALGGGTERHVRALAEATGSSVLILRPSAGGAVLRAADPPFAAALAFDGPEAARRLAAILRRAGVGRVHIHHVQGFPPPAIRQLVDSLGLPFDVTLHDFRMVCPQVTLTAPDGLYCGEPAAAGCNACLAGRPVSGAPEIGWWRATHDWLIHGADRLICPSLDGARRIERHFGRRPEVVPHQAAAPVAAASWDPPPRLRVVLLGDLTQMKGAALVEATLRDAAGLPIDVRLIGQSIPPLAAPEAGQFVETGAYREADLPALIGHIAPHLFWFPAQVPESFSYTLSAAMATGLPILASGHGAFPERLAGRPFSWVLPPRTTPGDVVRLLARLQAEGPRRFAADPEPAGPPPEPTSPAEARPFPHLRVLVVPELAGAAPGACGYIRLLLPLRHPAVRAVATPIVLQPAEVLRHAGDLLVIQRAAVADRDMAERIIAHCRTVGMRLVLEIDDDLFGLEAGHADAAHYRPALAALELLAAEADGVWTSTVPLADRLAGRNRHVTVLPNALDEQLWELGRPAPAAAPGSAVRLLYMAGPSHAADLAWLRPVLRRLGRTYGRRIRIDVVGLRAPALGSRVRQLAVPGQEAIYPRFVRRLKRCGPYDIGLAPLADTPFNAAKSGIKVWDYAALGAVTVASDAPGYRAVVRHGENGVLVANRLDAWYDALDRLIEDHGERQRLQDRAVRDLTDHHTLAHAADLRIAALRQAASAPAD